MESEAKVIWENFFGEKKFFDLSIQESSLKYIKQSIKNNGITNKIFDTAKNFIVDNFPSNNFYKFLKSRYLFYLIHNEESLKKGIRVSLSSPVLSQLK